MLAVRFARREMRGGFKGFRLFLACLALGAGGIAAVGSIASAINTALSEDAQILMGGDVLVRLNHRDITEDQRRWIEGSGRVTRVLDFRGMARTETGDGRSLVELKAIDTRYPLYGALVVSPKPPGGKTLASFLARRDGVWGAAADAGLFSRLGLKIGDRVQLGSATFELRAVVEREPDRASGRQFIQLGPRVMIASASLKQARLIKPGSLVYYDYKIALKQGTRIDAWTAALKRAFPRAAWQVQSRDSVTPRIQRLLDRMALFLTLVGLTTLLVGGVGVGNAVRAHLMTRMETIATLKCMGASSGLIFRIYLVQVMAMAVGGVALGVVAGALLPFALASALQDLLPLPLRFAIYPAPLMLAGAFGLLTALAFSIWPVARACRISPARLFRASVAHSGARPGLIYMLLSLAAVAALAALAVFSADHRQLASYFVIGALAAMVIFRVASLLIVWLARHAPSPRRVGIRLAIANLHRPGTPTPDIVLSLGLGLTVLVIIALVQSNLERQVTETLPSRAPDHFYIDIQPDQVASFEALVGEFDGVDSFDRVPMLRGRIIAVNGVLAHERKRYAKAWVLQSDRGITWSALPPAGSPVVQGNWWSGEYRGEPLISLARGAAQSLGVGIGDSLTVNILGREITGRITNLRRVVWQSLNINFMVIFSPGVLDGAPQTHIATVRASGEVADRIEQAVIDRYDNISAIRVRDAFEMMASVIDRIGIAVRGAGGVTLLAGIMVLAGAIAASQHRRIHDSVILKVLGATRGNVLRVMVLEFALLGFAAAGIALMLGTIGAWFIVRDLMRLDWVLAPAAALWTAGLVLMIAIVAGIIGTLRAMGRKAAPLLRNE